VLREVTGGSLAEFCQEVLWRPLGAEADAAWCTDSRGQEFNCVGFSCRLRDWARLGQLVAQRGVASSGQVSVLCCHEHYAEQAAAGRHRPDAEPRSA
jgi:CubicO group peptidase (beta-lactamase class C family)